MTPAAVTFQALYSQYSKLVISAVSFLPSRQDREDAAQTTWIKIDHALGTGTKITHPRAFILTVAKNEARQLLRAATTDADECSLDSMIETGHEPAEDEDENEQMHPALKAKLLESVECLSPRERQVITARFWDCKSVKEIAADLDITVPAVTMAISRAMSTLRLRFVRGERRAA